MSKRQPINPETITAEQASAELAKLLETAGRSYGLSPDDLWSEWLSYAVVALETGLKPFRNGVPLDTQPLREEEERLRNRFSHTHGRYDDLMNAFREGFALWYHFSACHFQDVLGITYMAYMTPNKGAGQVFTPWPVAQMMAQISVGDREAASRLVFDRLREAVERLREADPAAAIFADAVMMTAAFAVEAEGVKAFQGLLLKIIPLIAPYYEPITISDPACGSGNMLVAAASCFPAFAVRLGLVQFYGQDISHTCTLMAHLNEMAYGLNGWGAASVIAELAEMADQPQPLPTLPEPEAASLPHVAPSPNGRANGSHIKREDSLLNQAEPVGAVLLPAAPTITVNVKGGGQQHAFAFLMEEGATQ